MNKKEAIQILSTRDAHGVLCGYTSGVPEALDMAIEALNNSIQMSNIQQLEAENGALNEMIKFYRNELVDMVSVVRCKDCRHCSEYYDRDGYPYWECDEWDSGTDADGFCYHGERSNGE